MPFSLFAMPHELRGLALSSYHPPAARRERVNLIVTRVRQIAGIFGVLTLAWVALDAWTIAWPRWGEIALGRGLASAVFAGLAAYTFPKRMTLSAYGALGVLIVVPIAFFFFANGLLGQHASEDSLAAVTAYYYMPFIIAAGLSIFPLTVLESLAFGSLPVLTMIAGVILWPNQLGEGAVIATIWRLMLIAGISALAGMSQLRFLLLLTDQATRDGLTGLLVRRVGEELLEQQFAYAQRNNLPFSVLFLDLDHFKSVNDSFGHEAGDTVLRNAAASLNKILRLHDIMVRWGGEEFLVALPGADAIQAEAAVRRLASAGIGLRPDGKPLTASIGIAERKLDGSKDMAALLGLADQRMYVAKRAGRNRYMIGDVVTEWMTPGAATAEGPAARLVKCA